ncbi:hypothetical protein [Actinoplanes italicus]|uniref:hypothetical protein n=1 Tax=Actinoplanes italicus TaxID=113567 RepID=UPI0011B1DE24|nr:hypothetical protein [Actinoplanes italicus]
MKNDLGRRLAYTALFLTPGIFAAVASVRAWSVWLVALLVAVALLIYSLVRPSQARPAAGRSRWSAVVAVALPLAVAVFGVAGFFAARLVALDLWGEPETVRVDSVERAHRVRGDEQVSESCYRLTHPDGTPVTGRICRDTDEFATGATITVLADPAGWVAPETPDRVSGLRLALPRGLALGAFAVIVVAGLTTGGTTRRSAPPARRGRTPTGPAAPRRRTATPPRRTAAAPRRRPTPRR